MAEIFRVIGNVAPEIGLLLASLFVFFIGTYRAKNWSIQPKYRIRIQNFAYLLGISSIALIVYKEVIRGLVG